jgi:hypothetical protein
MNMMYNFLVEENQRLQKQVDELQNFLYVVQVSCSHLLQDGDVNGEAQQTIKRLLSLTEEMLDKNDKETKFR